MHHTYCERTTELQKVQNLGLTEASVTGQSHSKIRTCDNEYEHTTVEELLKTTGRRGIREPET
jgi:hypothetical protein